MDRSALRRVKLPHPTCEICQISANFSSNFFFQWVWQPVVKSSSEICVCLYFRSIGKPVTPVIYFQLELAIDMEQALLKMGRINYLLHPYQQRFLQHWGHLHHPNQPCIVRSLTQSIQTIPLPSFLSTFLFLLNFSLLPSLPYFLAFPQSGALWQLLCPSITPTHTTKPCCNPAMVNSISLKLTVHPHQS